MPTYTFMCERCTKSFEVVLSVAERAAAKVACPTCGGGKITPQMAIFTAKTSRKSEDPRQARCPDAARYPSPGSQVRVIETATGGRRPLRADTRSELPAWPQ